MIDGDRCPCGGIYESRKVEVKLHSVDSPVVITDIPQEVCPLCGSRTYPPWALERIEALTRGTTVDPQVNRLRDGTLR